MLDIREDDDMEEMLAKLLLHRFRFQPNLRKEIKMKGSPFILFEPFAPPISPFYALSPSKGIVCPY